MIKGYRKEICINGHFRTADNVGKNSNCLRCSRERTANYARRNEVRRASHHRTWQPLKIEVLTCYGFGGVLRCCWNGCTVDDIDMLTLDHVNNDGNKHKKEGRKTRLSGRELYRWVKNNNYPDNFQTLCWNHQWKKRIAYIQKLRG